ncbi:MAG TPA: VanZ family protein [Methylocella sp.]|nr:VanZ family protein [Methylocella sp.]
MNRLTFIAKLAGLCGIVAIIILSLLPGDYRPHTGLPGRVEHFIAYGLTATALALGFRPLAARLAFAGVLVLLAGAMEVLQQYVPDRHPAIADALASSLGGLLGLALGAFLYEWLTPIEHRRQALKPRL